MITLLQQVLLRCAALLVAGSERREWLAEWRSELWYARRELGPRRAMLFCFGAIHDALWYSRNSSRCGVREIANLDSPARCVGLLTVFAAASLLVAYHIPDRPPITDQRSEPSFLLIFVVACLIIMGPQSLSLADYRANRSLPCRLTRLGRWVFLAAKIALILLTSYAPLRYLDYAAMAHPRGRPAGLVVQFVVWGLVFTFRWSLHDQGERCPVCLRRLGNPVRVGEPAGYFLEWNCTEFMCLRGHGMLYVPECHTSWFNRPRWYYMDCSTGASD